MKKDDIKGIEAVNMKSTLTPVSSEQLKSSGKPFGGINFWVNDTITFPNWENVEIFMDSFEDRNKVTRQFPVIKVALNGKVRVIPVGSFRRHMSGVQESIEAYGSTDSFHRDIVLAQSDWELMQIFAGKTVRVRDKFDAKTIKFEGNNRVAYNRDNASTYNTAKWPLFEVIEDEK